MTFTIAGRRIYSGDKQREKAEALRQLAVNNGYAAAVFPYTLGRNGPDPVDITVVVIRPAA